VIPNVRIGDRIRGKNQEGEARTKDLGRNDSVDRMFQSIILQFV
jgi:hypothetical protein